MQLSTNHETGYFLLSRSLFESGVWQMHADYLKIFIYLIGQAAHTERRYKGYVLMRSQCFCSCNALAELIGYRRKKGTLSRAKRILDYLRKEGIIHTESKPRGIIVTLLNYDKYQRSENYERAGKRTRKELENEPEQNRNRLPINNNGNNGSNEKNDKWVSLRKRLVKHIGQPDYGIENSEGYMRKIERTCSRQAIMKAERDWRQGAGVAHPNQFFQRCKHYEESLSNSDGDNQIHVSESNESTPLGELPTSEILAIFTDSK